MMFNFTILYVMRFAALLALSFAALSAACAESTTPQPVCASNAPCASRASMRSASADTPQSAPARVWSSRCGACHVRVEPGTRDRATLETALKRHRTRVRMDEPQWAALVDFLATPP
jgi:hypothetical protein